MRILRVLNLHNLPIKISLGEYAAAASFNIGTQDFFSKFYRESCNFQMFIYIVRSRSHFKKKVSGFAVPSRDVTNQTLPGRE
jgi:hypothetical protein